MFLNEHKETRRVDTAYELWAVGSFFDRTDLGFRTFAGLIITLCILCPVYIFLALFIFLYAHFTFRLEDEAPPNRYVDDSEIAEIFEKQYPGPTSTVSKDTSNKE